MRWELISGHSYSFPSILHLQKMPRPLGPELFLLFHILQETWTILNDLWIDKWSKSISGKGKVKKHVCGKKINVNFASFSRDSSVYLFQTKYLFTTRQQKPQVLHNNRHICSAIHYYSHWIKQIFVSILVETNTLRWVIPNKLVLFQRVNNNNLDNKSIRIEFDTLS